MDSKDDVENKVQQRKRLLGERRGFQFKDPRAFTACLTFGTMIYGAGFSYTFGVVRTLEKRFSLTATEVNTLFSVMDFTVSALVLFVGYAGGKVHKTRLLGALLLFMVAAQLLFFAGPYFYFINNKVLTESTGDSENGTEWLCSNQLPADDGCSTDDGNNTNAEGDKVFPLFVLGALFMGVAGSGLLPLGLSYIDENVPPEKAAAHLGFATAAWPLGPVVGLFLASGCTSLPENLSGGTGLASDDEDFIGAWWLGFLLIGIASIFIIIPLFFFPKHMEEYYDRNKDSQNKETQNTDEPETVTFMGRLRELKAGVVGILTFGVVWTLVLSSVFVIYGLQIGGNMPRYMEIHFHQPPYLANIMAGVGAALAAAIGCICGGFVMNKFNMGIVGAARFYAGILTAVVVCCVGLTFMSCQQPPMIGVSDQSSVAVLFPCNSNCSCVDDAPFDPVCSDGISYYSACHAGCQNFDKENDVFTDCQCTGGTAEEGSCDPDCALTWPYVALIFISALIGASSETPLFIMFLRTVREDQKSFVLAFVSFMNNLLGFVPGPLIMGKLVDSACVIWHEECGETGECLYYDSDDLRIRTHVVPTAFTVVACLLGIATYYLIKRKNMSADISTDL